MLSLAIALTSESDKSEVHFHHCLDFVILATLHYLRASLGRLSIILIQNYQMSAHSAQSNLNLDSFVTDQKR